jgi:hypothetical protein
MMSPNIPVRALTRRPGALGLAALLVGLSWSTSATAAPVTIRYTVNVTAKCNVPNYSSASGYDPFVCTAINQNVGLVLTFDDGVTSSFPDSGFSQGDNTWYAAQYSYFGNPVFRWVSNPFTAVPNPLGGPTAAADRVYTYNYVSPAYDSQSARAYNQQQQSQTPIDEASRYETQLWVNYLEIDSFTRTPFQGLSPSVPTVQDFLAVMTTRPVNFTAFSYFSDFTCDRINFGDCTASAYRYSPESYSVAGTATVMSITVNGTTTQITPGGGPSGGRGNPTPPGWGPRDGRGRGRSGDGPPRDPVESHDEDGWRDGRGRDHSGDDAPSRDAADSRDRDRRRD